MKHLYVILLSLFFSFSNVLIAQQEIDLCLSRDSEYTYTVTSSVENTTFYWTLDGQSLFGQKPIIDWGRYEPGTYVLSVYGVANGCTSETLKYLIIVQECASIYIPSSFTPNYDGTNDTWYPIGEGWETIEVTIFNRWGELIFESNDLEGSWDGTYMGNPEVVQNDVYVYHILWKGVRSPIQSFYGRVTLIK